MGQKAAYESLLVMEVKTAVSGSGVTPVVLNALATSRTRREVSSDGSSPRLW